MKQLNLGELNEVEVLAVIASSSLYMANLTSDLIDNIEDREMVLDNWFKILTTLEVVKKAIEEIANGDLLRNTNN
jgi:hypothetical protein